MEILLHSLVFKRKWSYNQAKRDTLILKSRMS